MECDTTEVEVRYAIQSLKSGKAPGPNGLNGEFYKYSAHCVVVFLTKYSNKLILEHIHCTGPSRSYNHFMKKGDINSPDNYMGIPLLNNSSKIYSYILGKRLAQWVEENSIINEAQAGFRRNYSPLGPIFTLLTLVQRQLRITTVNCV